jgi:putative transposase
MILKSSGVDTAKAPYQAPNANSHSERYVLSCKRGFMDHLMIFGLSHLQHVLDCYRKYFNSHRPHQGINNKIPDEYNKKPKGGSKASLKPAMVARKDILGGLLKSYRMAA